MNREPKVSEIEKLIKHFHDTDRENELLEILNRHKIGPQDDPTIVVNPDTHEISEEAIALKRIAKREGLPGPKHKPLKELFYMWKHKWYVRYTVYYVILFLFFIFTLNAPMIISRFRSTDDSKAKIITVQELEEQKMEPSAPLDPGEVVTPGSWLFVPKLSVEAPIVMGESNDEAVIQGNLTKGVVHYKGTALPGEVGNSFVTGHSSNFWWIKGNYNYIFANLGKLVVGDQAKIYYNGNKFVYQVREIKEVLPTDVSVLAQTDTPVLTLMTCTPAGTNWRRLIIVLDQVSPKYVKPRIVEKQIVDDTGLLPSTDSNSMGAFLTNISKGFKEIIGF